MKRDINKVKVVFEGRRLEIDIEKELCMNEKLLNCEVKDWGCSYYIVGWLRDKYIKERDGLGREKEEGYCGGWVFIKDWNERLNNE